MGSLPGKSAEEGRVSELVGFNVPINTL